MVCSCIPEAGGHNGTVQAKRAKSDTREMAPDMQTPRHNLAHFCCAQCCPPKHHLFLISPSPSPKSKCTAHEPHVFPYDRRAMAEVPLDVPTCLDLWNGGEVASESLKSPSYHILFSVVLKRTYFYFL